MRHTFLYGVLNVEVLGTLYVRVNIRAECHLQQEVAAV